MAAPDTNPLVNRTEEVPAIGPPKTRRERFRVLISRRRSKRGRLWLIIGALAVVLVGGHFLWRYFSSYESTDDAQVDIHLYPVSSRISGYVIKVNVGDNQWVDKGTVLAEIDPRDYQVAVDKARADLANAEATARSLNIVVPITSVNTSSQLSSAASDVENAQAGITAAEKQLAAAHAQVEQAEANDVETQDDLKRYKLLVDKQEVSAQIYDQSLAAAKASTATVAAARANEEAAQQAVQQARSKLAQAEASHRYAQTGPQQVASSRVTANFKETQLGHMRPGQRVNISVDSNRRNYRGRVDSIGGATGPLFSVLPPENATGNYVKIVQRVPVKIYLDPGENRDHWLRPGMSVEPKVYLR